jgi:hypothetical protein
VARRGADWQLTIVFRGSFSLATNVYPKRSYARHSHGPFRHPQSRHRNSEFLWYTVSVNKTTMKLQSG